MKKLTTTIVAGLLFLYFMLPFGNHLGAIGVPEKDKNIYEKIYLNYFLSKARVRLFGTSCNANIFLFENRKPVFLEFNNASTGGLIELYEANRSRYSESERLFVIALTEELINSCDPDIGLNGTPPLADAILTFNYNFFSKLIDAGANPDFHYNTSKTKNLTPRKIINHLLDRPSTSEEGISILKKMKLKIDRTSTTE